jgi:hypothetical protein
MDVRAGLAAELRRLVRTGSEWPMHDRRRFRNLLLDAVTSDAMPLAEVLLRAHDDGMLRSFPERTASRAAWASVAARLVSDLQTQRFVEPGIARFVADAWVGALGPDAGPSARAASPRPVVSPRQPPHRSPPPATPPRTPMPASTASAASTAASVQAYQRSNMMLLALGAVFVVLTILAFRSTSRPRTEAAPSVTPAPTLAPAPVPAAPRVDAPMDVPVRRRGLVVRDSAPTPPPVAPHPPIAIAAAPSRANDDIVMKAGRVIEGSVQSVRQQTISVRDAETGLEFEIPKADVDRVVTRDGRTLRFGDDNVPLVGTDDALAPVSHAGRYRVRYAERWGAQRAECREMARQFAPGDDLDVKHLRGAPMMNLSFIGGQGFNAAVRTDGLFESGSDVAAARGPQSSFVSTRISGRITRAGVLTGVARLNAVTVDGATICDLALTMRGERAP